MFKRLSALLLALCFLCAAPLTAHADVVFDNKFTPPLEEQERIGRYLVANGPDGSVSVKEEPGSKVELFRAENGQTIYIAYVYYYKGQYWGGMGNNSFHGSGLLGWIPMDQLLIPYDNVAFTERYGYEFYTYTGSTAALEAAKEVVLWSWPGSESRRKASAEEYEYRILYAWADEAGREWAYALITHPHSMCGSYSFRSWLCLSEPANENIPAFNPAPPPQKWLPSDEYETVRRYFYANGESGSVSVKIAPGADFKVGAVLNGERLYVDIVIKYNGEYWGRTIGYYSVERVGWVPMDQLLMQYDYRSFAREHDDEFYAFIGSIKALEEAREVVLWAWPGADGDGRYKQTQLYPTNPNHKWDFKVLYAYKDGDGREWVFTAITQYWDSSSYNYSWLCLSDPSNMDIPAFNPAPTPQIWQPGTTGGPGNPFPPDPGSEDLRALIIIACLVTALIAGTLVMLWIFYKKPKKDAKTE